MTSRRSKLFLRALVVLVMGIAVGAPTPGHIGGCNTVPVAVDPEIYCRDKQNRICARDQVAGRITEAEAVTCRNEIAGMCAGSNFPAGCAPTAAAANTCLDALVDASRIGQLESDFFECTSLCDGSGGGIDPEGI